MRFNKVLIIGLLLVFTACTNREEPSTFADLFAGSKTLTVSVDSVELRPQEGLVYFQDEPYTGTTVDFYSNGSLASSIDYINGKKHGYYKKWFEGSLLSFESEYSNGKKNGITKTWWRNGNLRTESHYEAGVPHGLQKQWYKSGAMLKQIQLDYGKEKGLQQSWRENGKLYNNYEAKNGRIFGLKRANLCYELDNEIVQYKE